MIGQRDAVGTHFLTRRYFEMLEAPHGETLVTFEGTGHRPHLDEPNRFRTILAGAVREQCVAGAPPAWWPEAA